MIKALKNAAESIVSLIQPKFNYEGQFILEEVQEINPGPMTDEVALGYIQKLGCKDIYVWGPADISENHRHRVKAVLNRQQKLDNVYVNGEKQRRFFLEKADFYTPQVPKEQWYEKQQG